MADGVNYSLKGFDQYEILLGDELRGERATLGKSLLDVQRELKIKASYIAAIENCDLQVFSNKGFIAGYVKSYARYLGLDPEPLYERFCRESGFSNQNKDLTWQTQKVVKSSHKNFGPESDWEPGKIGQINYTTSVTQDVFLRSAPALLVLIVLFGSVFGGISVLKHVQKLDIVAFEAPPEIFAEPTNSVLNLSIISDVYSSEELAIPLFEPRDKALATLKPDVLTALENKVQPPVMAYSRLDRSLNVANEVSLNDSHSNYGLPDPVVRTAPSVPEVKILAITPAWVIVKNGNGDIVFEKILKERETYLIDKRLFKGQLRVGNAQNVYFVVDKKVFGPLSKDKSVVKKISLDPVSIKESFLISVGNTEVYGQKWLNETIVDTAEVVD
ncbi:MAG: DUF4115 domain-containing protein [Paracoccaceae bacterium]|nr:DUF4115 domain-containing protein [Paracoccaceae bacterium]